MNRHFSKPGSKQSRITKNFPHAKFVSTCVHGQRVIVGKSEAARCVGRSHDRAIAKRQNSINLGLTELFHYAVRRHFRRFEFHGKRAVTPRVFQLVAAVRDVRQFDAEFFRGFIEAPRLVTKFRGEKQYSFLRHGGERIHVRQNCPRSA